MRCYLKILVILLLAIGCQRPAEPVEHIDDASFKTMRVEEIAKPPLVFETSESSQIQQASAFWDWGLKNNVAPEVLELQDWFDSPDAPENDSIDKVVVNATTGGRYHIIGSRGKTGAVLEIRFIGNH